MIIKGEACPRFPWRPISIAQQLHITAADFPDSDAFISEFGRLTWRETETLARQLAKGLLAMGVQPGDHIALWVPNRSEWPLMWFAAAHIGAVTIPINTRYKVDEVAHILRQSDTRVLIMVDRFLGIDYLHMLDELCPNMTDESVPPNREDFPHLEGVVVIGESPAGTRSWSDLIGLGTDISDEFLDGIVRNVHFEDPTIIVYTSGTTGFPKGAVHSHRILRNECSIAGYFGLESDSRILGHMPFFHVAGSVTGIMVTLISGGALVLMERWDPTVALELVEREKVSFLGGIPTHFIDLLSHPDREKFDTSSLRCGWIGGAMNPREVIDGVIRDLGMKVLPTYGMTETTSATVLARIEDDLDVVYAGKGLPVSDFELKISGPDGQALPPGSEGEIAVRGHLVMKGYYKDPDATAQVLKPDGWFHTGDLGVLDPAGYLSVTGRKSDMFIVGGSNAYPAEIERVLASHPAISQAYVVGVPEPRLGEVGFAFVQLRAGMHLTEDEVRDFCKAKLANFKIPQFVKFVEAWPQTATGKIERFRLKQLGVAAASSTAISAGESSDPRASQSRTQ